jgi:predicted glycosyltransferase involved in capsule biosynthesis
MKDHFIQLSKQQQRKIIQSFNDDKQTWKDIFSAGVAYKRQLNPLFDTR